MSEPIKCRECWEHDQHNATYLVKAIAYDYYFKPHKYVGYLCEVHFQELQQCGAHILKAQKINIEEGTENGVQSHKI